MNGKLIRLNKTVNHSSDEAAARVRQILSAVHDPEIPVLSLEDLGVLRNIEVDHSNPELRLFITVTPTYSGCPALDVMKREILFTLQKHGYTDVEIRESLYPAWTSDWMSESGKEKLKAYGIAPPGPAQSVCDIGLFQRQELIECPRCNSVRTSLLSQFGSTPCKALYVCRDCQEPFEHFKCH